MMRMSISCDYYIDVRHDTNTNTAGTCRLSVVSDCNNESAINAAFRLVTRNDDAEAALQDFEEITINTEIRYLTYRNGFENSPFPIFNPSEIFEPKKNLRHFHIA